MRFLFYTHSLVSDWNHGNAHFLRGVMRELQRQGHRALALEPAGGWSRTNLRADAGEAAEAAFAAAFPDLRSTAYGPEFDHDAALDAADVVVVHEWTDPALVARIGRARAEGGRFALLFHDTHHRAVTREGEIRALDLSAYDAVLAFGESLRDRYLRAGWGRQVVTWHEAADTTVFRPLPDEPEEGDLVWVGNWGDGERAAELWEFLVEPVRALGLRATVHGVRYPEAALDMLAASGIAYRGWIANADVPRSFSRHRVTVHVPRGPYAAELPGIPTIRPFEAMACGIPLVSAPWEDVEGLFRPGDYLTAMHGKDMRRKLDLMVRDPAARAEVAARGRETVLERHTCRHRVDELLAVLARLGLAAPERRTA
jgi:spore maturation protein CgeB